MTLAEFLGVLPLVIGVPLNLVVTVLLLRSALERPRLWMLFERFVSAVFVLVLTVSFAIVFRSNDLDVPFLDPEVARIWTRAAVDAVSIVPALFLLWLNYRRR